MKPIPGLVTLVQARVGSTRLPGKVLLPLVGAPLLVRVLERVVRARLSGTVVVVTTDRREDDAVVALCRRYGFPCFRGHPTDLLDRHVQAARTFGARHVVKVPSDCPLIAPEVIDCVLASYGDRLGEVDYVSNLHPPSWPDGNDVEVASREALETAWREASRTIEREHTTPFLWERPERFRIGNVAWDSGLDLSMSHRFTVDYPEDHAFAARVYDALYPENPGFGLREILALLDADPGIARLNARHAGVNWYRHHLGELRTVTPGMTRQAVEA